MSKKPESLEKGDWIVHAYYGIGQIKTIETKSIGEDKARYYRVDAANSTFFVPVKDALNDRIRMLSSSYKLRKAKQVLRSKPEQLPENHNDRRKLISEITSHSEMDTSAQMIRDLLHRKADQGLNDYEQKIFDAVEALFLQEWSIIEEISLEEARLRLEKIYEEIKG